MRNRERITPPTWEGMRRGNRKVNKQTVQVRSHNITHFSTKMQYAARVLAARYGLSLSRARVVASLAGIGGA
jgi:hypothetical protein